jgi:hypothetical protein
MMSNVFILLHITRSRIVKIKIQNIDYLGSSLAGLVVNYAEGINEV